MHAIYSVIKIISEETMLWGGGVRKGVYKNQIYAKIRRFTHIKILQRI